MINIWYWDRKPLLLEFPTYTAMWPLGTSEWFLLRRDRCLRIFLALWITEGKRKDIHVRKCWRIWIELALVDWQGDWQWRRAPSACRSVSAEAVWSYEGLWLQRWEMGCIYFINEAKRDASHITRLCSTALILFSYSSKDNQTLLIVGDRRHRSWSHTLASLSINSSKQDGRTLAYTVPAGTGTINKSTLVFEGQSVRV